MKPLVVISDTLQRGTAFMLEDMWAHMLRAVRARAHVELPTSGQALVDLLKLEPQTVLLTNPAILRMQRPRAALLEWTRAGGNVVICGLFSIEIEYAEQAAMFKDWDLDWKGGSYHRTDFVLAPEFASTAGIPPAYNVKASHVVVPPQARIYVPAPGARTQSNVFDPESVDQSEAAVARDRCIDGTVSWVGDVNGEEETTPIILWLAGLTLAPPPRAPLTGFATATIRWSPTARAREEAPELTVAIGRGGAPFVWNLLRVEPSGEARVCVRLSAPASPEDTREPPVHTGGTVFTCHIPQERLLFSELSRAGLVDSGRSVTMQRGLCLAAQKEALLPLEDCARWCAGCKAWERPGGARYLRCSGCKSRFYCSSSCQNRDWRAYHKSICGLLKEGREPEVERLRLTLQS